MTRQRVVTWHYFYCPCFICLPFLRINLYFWSNWPKVLQPVGEMEILRCNHRSKIWPMCYMRSTTIYHPFVLRCMRHSSRLAHGDLLKEADVYDAEKELHINIFSSTSTSHQKLLVEGCNILLTSCTCSTIRKLNTPKLGRFSNLILVSILVPGISQ